MIGGLQVLRGVAATLVVLFHLQAAALNEGLDPGLFRHFGQGEAGVDVFFVLSGFVIFHAAARSPHLTARRFLAQRFWRIVPPYWAMLALTLLALAGLAVMRGNFADLPGVGQVLASVLLLPWPDQVMAVAWTLTLEAMFYLIFAASWFRGGPGAALLALAVWAGLAQLARALPGDLPLALSLPLYSGVLEFLYGAVIARLAGAGIDRFSTLALWLGVAGLGAVVLGAVPLSAGPGREVMAGLPAALLVYGLVSRRHEMPAWALLWGEASYLLYLSHLLVFSITGTVLRMGTGMTVYASPVGLFGLLVLATAVACALTLWAERPYRRWVRRQRIA